MTGIITSLPPLVEQPPGQNSSNPAGLPGVTYTFALLQYAQTWTAKQTFPLGNISLQAADIVGLATSATTDTTNAANIISGTLAAARMPALTGDVTTSAGAVATTLATVNSNVGTFGSGSLVPVITTNAKGLITAVSTTAVVTSGVSSFNGQTGALALLISPSGRLTLTSGVAITESDVSGATTIYFTPTDHDYTQLYDGTNFVLRTYTERSLILDATGHVTNTLYDVWEYWDGSAVQIGTGPAWTNSAGGTSARGTGAGTTEFEVYRGRIVNKNAIVLRNNSVNSSSIPARQANLRGTFRTTSAGMTEDSAAKRLLSNLYNAVGRSMHIIEATSGWTYSIATYRQANGSTANQLAFVECVSGREAYAQVVAHVGNSSGTAGAGTGIGVNSSTVDSSITRQFIYANAFATYPPQNATYTGYLGAGYNELRWLERGDGSANTQTWVGTASSVFLQSGMTGRVIN